MNSINVFNYAEVRNGPCKPHRAFILTKNILNVLNSFFTERIQSVPSQHKFL